MRYYAIRSFEQGSSRFVVVRRFPTSKARDAAKGYRAVSNTSKWARAAIREHRWSGCGKSCQQVKLYDGPSAAAERKMTERSRADFRRRNKERNLRVHGKHAGRDARGRFVKR